MAKVITFTDITTPTNLSATPVDGGTLLPNTTYYYRLFAAEETAGYYSWDGKSKVSDEFIGTTTTTDLSFEISFDMPEGECGSYRIWRGTTSDGYMNEYRRGCLYFTPLDSTYNVGGVVTFTDTGYADNAGNTSLENVNDPHGTIFVRGTTSADTVSIVDLYEADVANGWGVIEKLSNFSYKVNAYIDLDDQFWADSEMDIIFAASMKTVNTTAILGYSVSYPAGGCNIAFENPDLIGFTFAELFAYRTTFTYRHPVSVSGNQITMGFKAGELVECTINEFRGFTPAGGSACTFKDLIYNNCDNAFSLYAANYDGVAVHGGSRMWQLQTNQYVKAKGVKSDNVGLVLIIGSGIVLDVVDSTFTSPGFVTSSGDSTGSVVNDMFSFNLNVTDSLGIGVDSAIVSVYDKDNNLVVDTTTDINGDIVEEEIIRRVYGVDVNVFLEPETKYPFTLLITKSGKQLYKEIVSYEESLPVTKTVSLQDSNVSGTSGNVFYGSILNGVTIK